MNFFKHKCNPKKMAYIKFMGDKHRLDIQQMQTEYKCVKCGDHWYECVDINLFSGSKIDTRWHPLPRRLWTIQAIEKELG